MRNVDCDTVANSGVSFRSWTMNASRIPSVSYYALCVTMHQVAVFGILARPALMAAAVQACRAKSHVHGMTTSTHFIKVLTSMQ